MNDIRKTIGWADYRNGTSRIKSGKYFLVYAPGHPHAKSKGHVYEHRYVVEKILGRFLETREHVHHIDGDGNNNEPDNLQVLISQDHSRRTIADHPGIHVNGVAALNRYAAKIKKRAA